MITHYVVLNGKSGISVNGYDGRRRKSVGHVNIYGQGVRMVVDDFLDSELTGSPIMENYFKLSGEKAYENLKKSMCLALEMHYLPEWQRTDRVEISRRELVDRMAKAAKEVLPTFEKPKEE